MTTLTIVIVCDTAHVDGGASQVAISSALGLAESGVRVFFIAGVAPIDPRLNSSDIKVICLNQSTIADPEERLHAAFTALWNFKAQCTLTGLLTKLNRKNTVIHIHTWTKSLSSSVLKAASDAGFTVILTLHDYFLACPNGGFYDYQSETICTRKPLSTSCLVTHCDSRSYVHKTWRVLRQIIQIHLGGLPGGIKAFITVSDFSRRVLLPYLPASARIVHIPNPIECAEGPPADPGNTSTFVFVGRLSPEKGIHLLAQAAKLTLIPVTLIGNGPAFETLQKNNPLLRLTGWVQREEVNRLLNGARCLVFPSVWYETQGLVVSEAAARGIPAIVSDACAARDLIVHKETGLLFRSGSVKDLAACMRHMQDRNFARKLGAAAYRKFWSQPPRLKQHIADLLKIYAGVLVEK